MLPEVPKSSGIHRDPEATRAALIEAARLEFEEAGFDATQSNKIAARAGYAPQTFYRHFSSKVEIFLAVYAQWVADEQKALDGVSNMRSAAQVLIRHHHSSLRFRRALRQLAVSDVQVRKARSESRLSQIECLRRRLPHLKDAPLARLARALTTIERVADACAEGEYLDLGISAQAAEDQLTECLKQVLAPPSK
jgi:AcrR family transcriptional regulator